MSVKRRALPEAFEREAVDRAASSGLSAGAAARELGLHETVLRRWMMPIWDAGDGAGEAPPHASAVPVAV